MERKSTPVAQRFAENLVGQMLQRGGAVFHRPSSPDSAADFVVHYGDHLVVLEVKYTDDANNARSIWRDWRRAAATAPDNANGGHPAHLVIVTGTGDTVFADDTTAPLLGPDDRTSLSILHGDVGDAKPVQHQNR